MSELAKPWLEYKALRITHLPETRLRKNLSEMSTELAYRALGMRAYDVMGRRAGLHMISRGDPKRLDYRCFQFGFATVKQEPWANEDLPLPVFAQPLEYLWRRGYEPLKESELPFDGDLVAYGTFLQDNKEFRAEHIGVVDGYGIVSKFNYGHVFYHPIEKVPGIYGDLALYFRKASERYQVSAEREGPEYHLPFGESRRILVTEERAPLPGKGIEEAKPLTAERWDFLKSLNDAADPGIALEHNGYSTGANFKVGSFAVYSEKDIVLERETKPIVVIASGGRVLLGFPDKKSYWVPFQQAPNNFGNTVTFYD